MSKIYCIGETVYDVMFKNGQPVAAKAGGSMLNATVSLGRTQMPVHLVTEYALDNIGNEIDLFLKGNHVNTDFVYRYPDGKTSIAIAFLNENNDASYSFYKHLPVQRLNIALPAITNNDYVLFGSFYAINSEVRQQVKSFVENARKAGAIVYYDPNYRKAHLHELQQLMPMILENMSMADIVRGSDEDFEMIFNTTTFEDTYKQVSKYCNNLIRTENTKGVRALLQNNEYSLPVKELKPLSTIGAGDNFNAGMVYGLFTNKIRKEHLSNNIIPDWNVILKTAIDFASDVCMSYDNYISNEFASKVISK